MTDNDAKLDEEILEELTQKLENMTNDRDAKINAAVEQLAEQLRITADKYRTATGTMEALRVLRMVRGDGLEIKLEDEMSDAVNLADMMATNAMLMVDRVYELEVWKMDELCNGFYYKDFPEMFDKSDDADILISLDLMRLDLCRNVGPAAEDIKGFWDKCKEDIADVKLELEKL